MFLEVKNLSKKYGDKTVVDNLNFEMKNPGVYALLGTNGAGKTTSIRMMLGMLAHDSGEVLWNGRPLDTLSGNVGYLAEERGLYPKKTVIEQMVYLARLRGISKANAIANSKKWLTRLEVIDYEKKKLETLSKGNQQKVQLASTLVCNPDIIILDEPFSGLDPINSQILQQVVRELISENKIVIFSSHQMSYVEEFCEDIAIINHGEVVLSGDLDKIKLEYGEKQLVLSAVNLSLDELESRCAGELSDLLEITGKIKDTLIIKIHDGVTRNALLTAIISKNIEVEHFETYKPSLNDIFIAKVGEE